MRKLRCNSYIVPQIAFSNGFGTSYQNSPRRRSGSCAAMADMTGALGTGTGILLTVGILYRMYQDLENQKMFDNYSGLGGLFA